MTPTTSAQPRFATTTATSGQLAVRIFDHNGGLQQAQIRRPAGAGTRNFH